MGALKSKRALVGASRSETVRMNETHPPARPPGTAAGEETASTDVAGRSEAEATLRLEAFGIAFGSKTVVSSADLTVRPGAPQVLLGPSGAGKSSLLRAISATNFAHEATVTGEARLGGQRLSASNRATLVVAQHGSASTGTVADGLAPKLLRSVAGGGLPQHARLERAVTELERLGLTSLKARLAMPMATLALADVRTVLLVRFAAENPRMLALDEPALGMNPRQLFEYCSAVRALAERIPLIVATTDTLLAREMSGTLGLLAGGRLIEQRKTTDFFQAPLTAAGRDFVRTGTCPNPSPTLTAEAADPSFRRQYPEFFQTLAAPSGSTFLRECQSYAPPASPDGPTSVRRWGTDATASTVHPAGSTNARRTPTIPYLPPRDSESFEGSSNREDSDEA